jgi:hypothetical protein
LGFFTASLWPQITSNRNDDSQGETHENPAGTYKLRGSSNITVRRIRSAEDDSRRRPLREDPENVRIKEAGTEPWRSLAGSGPIFPSIFSFSYLSFLFDPFSSCLDCFHPSRSILKASGATLHLVGYQVRPDELDYSRVVVAISQIVIERREAMLLTGFLHALQLA